MPSAEFKLTYFDSYGLGDPVRYAFAMSGKPWQDNRISYDYYHTIKHDLPQNQVPILEVDGRILPQSNAQLRFVGKMAGLYPEDPLEAAFADAAVDSVADCFAKFYPYFHEENEKRKREIFDDLVTTYLPRWLLNMEKTLEAAGGRHFAGDKISIGDIAVACRLAWIKEGHVERIPTSLVDPYPLLNVLYDRVNAEPKIMAYKSSLAARK